MGNLPSLFAPPPVRVLILGLDFAGKTTVLYKWPHRSHDIVHELPTIGVHYETTTLQCRNGQDMMSVVAWGGGGRDPGFRWKIFYHLVVNKKPFDAIVYVVDSTHTDYDQDKDELLRFIQQVKQLKGLPVLILCNKQDLPGALSAEQVVHGLGIQIDPKAGRLVKDQDPSERFCRAMPCCAIKTQGIEEAFAWLCDAVERNKNEATMKTSSTLEGKDKREETTSQDDDESTASYKSGSSAESSISNLEYDPVNDNATLVNFRPIQRGTECPFAKAAKLWGGYTTRMGKSTGDSVMTIAEINAHALTKFVELSNTGEPLDGFCIEFPIGNDVGPLELGRRVREVLTDLSDCDPDGEAMMRKTYIGARGWKFRFASADFFVTTFAPCYPITSSRYAFGVKDRAFVLLQPELSFLRHNLPPDTPKTSFDNPRTIRDRTRLAFREADRSYHVPSTTKHPRAEHFVRPLNDDGKEVVRWWLD